jgi:hypothetical protein
VDGALRPPPRDPAPHASVENLERIGQAIAEAGAALDRVVAGGRIARDTHYQPANHVAYSWKLASMGIPILFVYFGFTGDDGIADVGPTLRDDAHWQSVMRRYTDGVLPNGFLDRWLTCGPANVRLIVRSRPVLVQSSRASSGYQRAGADRWLGA